MKNQVDQRPQVHFTTKRMAETNFSWTDRLIKEEESMPRFARVTIQCTPSQASEWQWNEPTLEEVGELYRPFLLAATKEVKQLPKINQKKFIRLMQQISVAMVPFIIGMSLPTTQAKSGVSLFPFLDKGKSLEVLPPEIMEILIQVIVACGVVGVALAILCLMIAGMYRMFGQVQKAHLWSVDIIKGLGQILLAPIIVLILVTLVSIMFSNVPGLNVFF